MGRYPARSLSPRTDPFPVVTRPGDAVRSVPFRPETGHGAAFLAAHVGVDTTSRYSGLALVARVEAYLERLVQHRTEPP